RVGMAVARNATVIPRSLWSGTALEDGDELELVTAVQGG
ncbi:sulfur carrier protein ThiS, partial [Arthrobacter sp.]